MSSVVEDPVAWMRRMFESVPVTRMVGANPLSYEPEADRVTVEYLAKPEFCNLIGSVQGGMLTVMLDNVMSFAALVRLGTDYSVPSLEVKTSFLAPARPGRIVGQGTIVRLGRSIAFLAGELTDDEGTVLATSTATAQVRKRHR